jgi:RNA-directed DNA polymerase
MEKAVERENRIEAIRAVVRNGGSPGIDKMTVQQLKGHIAQHWESIREKLRNGSYTPSPVKRVDIPKPGGGTRMLGIPTAMDRQSSADTPTIVTSTWAARKQPNE